MCLNKTCRNILGISEFSVGWVSVSIYSQDIKKSIFEVVFFSSLFLRIVVFGPPVPNWFIVSKTTEVLGHSAISNSEFSSLEGALGAPYCNEIFASGEFSVVFASLLLRELEIWKPTDHGKYKLTPSEDVLPEITWFHERVSLVKGFSQQETSGSPRGGPQTKRPWIHSWKYKDKLSENCKGG